MAIYDTPIDSSEARIDFAAAPLVPKVKKPTGLGVKGMLNSTDNALGFIGGDVSSQTGNLVAGTAQQVNSGSRATGYGSATSPSYSGTPGSGSGTLAASYLRSVGY